MKTRIENLEGKIRDYKTNLISEFLENQSIDIDLDYYFDEDFTSFDELRDAIEDGNGFDCDVIYYANAIEYLQENDPSLQESLSIAAEYGFTPENLNSEVLASLLKSQNIRDEFYELESEFEGLFEELEEINGHLEILSDLDLENIEETENELEELENIYSK